MSAAEQHKYDRQLRLWGVHGQKLLMNSHVCLLNAGPTGTETLKNLVLPGIGEFTVVDGETTTEFDLTNNFFVDASWKGKPRAEAIKSLLTEMNPDVKGNALVRNPIDIISKDSSFFSKFSLIIATQMDQDNLIKLGDICDKLKIHLVIARTYGLIGHVRIFSSEHRVVELKQSPEPSPDLRINNPFPSLKKLADEIDFDKMDQFDFQHTPFVLVLIKLLENWKKSHSGKVPETSAEKAEFRNGINAISKMKSPLEENLVEALKFNFQAYRPVEIPYEVKAILEDSKCTTLDKNSPNFWVMARGLKEFCSQNNGLLPLPGTLPDMTATTEKFVQLQKCFSEKAAEDLGAFSKYVDMFLKQIGRTSESISQEERLRFCSNASGLVVIRTRSLKEETEGTPVEELDNIFMEDVDRNQMNPFIWYLFWRTCDDIYSTTGLYPGQDPKATAEQLKNDATSLFQKTKAFVQKKYPNLPLEFVTEEVAQEMTRYGACEMHNIAAVIGGEAAQETIKLITQQYYPLNNTYVFNGIVASGKFFQL